MCIAVRQHDPSNLKDKDVLYPVAGETVIKFLERCIPDGFGGVETSIFLNGDLDPIVCTSSGKSSGFEHIIKPKDQLVIMHRPSGAELLIAAVAAVVTAVASILLMPEVPGNAESQGSSPNNQLNSATNSFRPDEAIPEVFGSPVCYPDFVQPSWYEYEDNLKVLRELFCITAGSCNIRKVSSSDTDILDIPNSTWQSFDTAAGQIPPQEYRLTVRETNEITNRELPAPNDKTYEQQISNASVSDSGLSDTDIAMSQDDWEFIYNSEVRVGDYITVFLEGNNPSGPGTITFSGTFELSAIDSPSRTITLANTGQPQFASVVNGVLTVTDSSGEVENWIGYYTAPGTEVE